MRFFRRGSSTSRQPHDHDEPEAPVQPPDGEPSPETPTGMVESLFPGEPPEPDLIGEEWKQGSPDETVPEPSRARWDLAEGPARCSVATALVEPAPSCARSRPQQRPRRPPSPRSRTPGAPTTAPRRPTRRAGSASARQLEAGLERSRTGSARGCAPRSAAAIDADWDEIEEILITGDIGAELAMDVVEQARRQRNVTAEAGGPRPPRRAARPA